MKTIEQIDFGKMKAVISQVNKCGILERFKKVKEPIRTIGIKKTAVLDSFLQLMEEVSDNNLDPVLPKEVVNFYNDLFSDEMTEEQKEKLLEPEEEAPEAEPEVEEPEVEVKAKKPPTRRTKRKETVEPQKLKKKTVVPKEERVKTDEKEESAISRYGHRQSAMSGELDDMIWEGHTFEEICDALGVMTGRIKGHIKVLQKKGITVTVDVNTENPQQTFVKAQQEQI